MRNKMGNKMGIVLSWEFCTDGGIWVLGYVGFWDLLDILVCECKGITWEREIWGAEPPKCCRAASKDSKTLPGIGNLNCFS